jgi:hypothetical protein
MTAWSNGLSMNHAVRITRRLACRRPRRRPGDRPRDSSDASRGLATVVLQALDRRGAPVAEHIIAVKRDRATSVESRRERGPGPAAIRFRRRKQALSAEPELQAPGSPVKAATATCAGARRPARNATPRQPRRSSAGSAVRREDPLPRILTAPPSQRQERFSAGSAIRPSSLPRRTRRSSRSGTLKGCARLGSN